MNTEQFEEEIQACFYSSTPLLLDVYAEWCGPCKLLAPQLEQVAEKYGERVRVLKIDADEEPVVASTLQVRVHSPARWTASPVSVKGLPACNVASR